jgi:hypothetical protein
MISTARATSAAEGSDPPTGGYAWRPGRCPAGPVETVVRSAAVAGVETVGNRARLCRQRHRPRTTVVAARHRGAAPRPSHKHHGLLAKASFALPVALPERGSSDARHTWTHLRNAYGGRSSRTTNGRNGAVYGRNRADHPSHGCGWSVYPVRLGHRASDLLQNRDEGLDRGQRGRDRIDLQM